MFQITVTLTLDADTRINRDDAKRYVREALVAFKHTPLAVSPLGREIFVTGVRVVEPQKVGA